LNKDYLWEKIRNEKLCSLVREVIRSSTKMGDKTQATTTSEIEILSPEKRLLHMHLSTIQIDKNTYGILLVFHDITELRKLENTRREFVANVSHELRTPLASIKGYVETLLENNDMDNASTREFLGIIMKHTQRLDNLIKDTLELSKLDSNDLKIELHHVDIHPCIEDIFSHYKESCTGRDQTFELDMPQHLPMIETDEYLLRQLLTNLLDNAIKYTPKGGRIGLKVNPINGSVQFEISDTGIGIPPEHIPRIFERFYRVDPARSREMGGTGLGLSIVKHIVSLHHGFIKVESAVDVGSKFIITLPQQQPKYAT
ncbi:MAG: ATP-binding protein, partial [Candidatus Brocadiaceae bacterium]|nr:ATP-binding protein [Candidatus Brocadiaceae bacterium]